MLKEKNFPEARRPEVTETYYLFEVYTVGLQIKAQLVTPLSTRTLLRCRTDNNKEVRVAVPVTAEELAIYRRKTGRDRVTMIHDYTDIKKLIVGDRKVLDADYVVEKAWNMNKWLLPFEATKEIKYRYKESTNKAEVTQLLQRYGQDADYLSQARLSTENQAEDF